VAENINTVKENAGALLV